eukprot:tig00020725_g13533.t1
MRRRRREDVRGSPAAGTPPPVVDEAEEPPKPLPTRYAFRAWSADDGAPVPYLEDAYAQRELRLLCGLVFCVSLAVYVRCLYPSVPGGDSGELILSACRLGIAHPPGYPTFVMLGRLFIELFRPFGSVAWRMNLMSAVRLLGASSSAGLLAAAATWTQNHPAALLGALMWAFSSLAWLYSTQPAQAHQPARRRPGSNVSLFLDAASTERRSSPGRRQPRDGSSASGRGRAARREGWEAAPEEEAAAKGRPAPGGRCGEPAEGQEEAAAAAIASKRWPRARARSHAPRRRGRGRRWSRRRRRRGEGALPEGTPRPIGPCPN